MYLAKVSNHALEWGLGQVVALFHLVVLALSEFWSFLHALVIVFLGSFELEGFIAPFGVSWVITKASFDVMIYGFSLIYRNNHASIIVSLVSSDLEGFVAPEGITLCWVHRWVG